MTLQSFTNFKPNNKIDMKNLLIFAVLTITLLSCAKAKVEAPLNQAPPYNGPVDTVTETLSATVVLHSGTITITTAVSPEISALNARCNVSYDVYSDVTFQYSVQTQLIADPGVESDAFSSNLPNINIRNVRTSGASYALTNQYFIITKFD